MYRFGKWFGTWRRDSATPGSLAPGFCSWLSGPGFLDCCVFYTEAVRQEHTLLHIAHDCSVDGLATRPPTFSGVGLSRVRRERSMDTAVHLQDGRRRRAFSRCEREYFCDSKYMPIMTAFQNSLEYFLSSNKAPPD